MNIFLDANVLVSVMNKEYPLFTYTSRIVSLSDSRKFKIFTSPVCLAIAFYFAQKKNKGTAKQKINTLTDHIYVAECGASCIKKALLNPVVNDFEDGIEYYSALESKCRCIITEDTGDFYFFDIEVLTSRNFFEKYMAGKSVK
jgi:predicted nucleic acid-binding protein